MFKEIFNSISVTQLFLAVTSTVVFFKYDANVKVHKLLLAILITSLAYEVLSTILFFQDCNHNLWYNVNTIVHHTLWLIILYTAVRPEKWFSVLIYIYGFIAIFEVFVSNDPNTFNTYVFLSGAMLYIIVFSYACLKSLFSENLAFFSNNILLLSAPVFLFIGLSFLLAFEAPALHDTIVLEKMSLYDFIVTFANFVCYTLINIYIYSGDQTKHT